MITIREYDNTKSPVGAYANFTVLVPGYRDKSIDPSPFGDEPALEFTSQKDFIEKIGQVEASEANQYGNQFAYELLGLGYTVLYADLETLETIYPVAGVDGTGVFTPFTDKAAYDFRYILPGVMTGAYSISGETVTDEVAAFNLQAIKCANIRQDCTALCDLNAIAYLDQSLITMSAKIERVKKLAHDLIANAQTTVNKQTVKGEYTALFANRPTYNISYGTNGVYTNKTFACGFHYLACTAKARENFAEWYAVGGYTRGKSNYAIDKLDLNFGDAAVEALQPRNGSSWTVQNQMANCVNIMVNIKGQLLLWGNSTAKDLETDGTDSELDTLKAGHFLNIRQLCTTIKKQVYVTCRRLTFNPNSSRLWSDFKGMVEPTLALAKSDQGCDDYLMTRVHDSRKAMMTAKIRIVPIEAVKDFDISLFLEDSISGAVIGEDESAD